MESNKIRREIDEIPDIYEREKQLTEFLRTISKKIPFLPTYNYLDFDESLSYMQGRLETFLNVNKYPDNGDRRSCGLLDFYKRELTIFENFIRKNSGSFDYVDKIRVEGVQKLLEFTNNKISELLGCGDKKEKPKGKNNVNKDKDKPREDKEKEKEILKFEDFDRHEEIKKILYVDLLIIDKENKWDVDQLKIGNETSDKTQVAGLIYSLHELELCKKKRVRLTSEHIAYIAYNTFNIGENPEKFSKLTPKKKSDAFSAFHRRKATYYIKKFKEKLKLHLKNEDSVAPLKK